MKKISNWIYISVLFIAGCAHTSKVRGTYVGFYELDVAPKVSCHFLMKKNESMPSVLCHDQAEAWVVPLSEFKKQTWITAPIITQSGNIVAFLAEDKFSKIEVVVSTDKGRSWDVYPSLNKKSAEDQFVAVTINKAGRIVASFEGKAKDGKAKKYEVGQEGSLKSKLSPVEKSAKSYPLECHEQYRAPKEAKISENCLTGYLKRLLNQ
jgi:hypothetical protein